VVVAYSVVNVVIQSLIQPKFVGDAVGLSVTLTLLSLVFGPL
jgi:predicted PurR-regulated permease PerM